MYGRVLYSDSSKLISVRRNTDVENTDKTCGAVSLITSIKLEFKLNVLILASLIFSHLPLTTGN